MTPFNKLMTTVYKDNTFIVTKHISPENVLIHVATTSGNLSNIDQAQYMIFRKGRLVGYDLTGNIVGTRSAGDTTDSSVLAEIPAEGVLSIDANSEFYCVMKLDKEGVTREILDSHHKSCAAAIGKTGVLCVMEGTLSLKASGIQTELSKDLRTIEAPAFVAVSDTDQIVHMSKKSWVILVS